MGVKSPIAILSFNRPELLAQTLRSIRDQAGDSIEGREIHLFQDGAVNRWSRLKYAEDGTIKRCVEVYRSIFPSGVVHESSDNIGICENFCRAEDHLFGERQFNYVWFFEDDMILSPLYFQMMDQLQNFCTSNDRLSLFAAYGDYYASRAEIETHRDQILPLDHHWAFGLSRSAWQRIRAALAEYYDLVRNSDYARRDHHAIYQYFIRSGLVPRGSSQDAAKTWACARLGLLRVRTYAVFARYIGAQGAHMTPERFEELGFSEVSVEAAESIPLKMPSDDLIAALIDEQRSHLAMIARREVPAILAGLPSKELSPMRRCERDDVVAAYRLLLCRCPESEDIIEGHLLQTAVYTLVRGLLNSPEYLSLQSDVSFSNAYQIDPKRLCTVGELGAAYRILLHREADAGTLAARVGREPIFPVTQSILRSDEFLGLESRIVHPW